MECKLINGIYIKEFLNFKKIFIYKSYCFYSYWNLDNSLFKFFKTKFNLQKKYQFWARKSIGSGEVLGPFWGLFRAFGEEGSRWRPDGPRGLQDGPREAQDRAKIAQDWPKMVQDRPKIRPRWPKKRPRQPKTGPK